MTQATAQHKIQLTGSILGIESCRIVTDSDVVRIGSALDADMVVADPLVPPVAFVLRRLTHHSADTGACGCKWIVEARSRARMFLNDRLTTRDHIAFGDTISSGLHRFVFRPADQNPRNCKSITSVTDLCAGLLKEQPLPAGFLKSCPRYLHLERLRRAGFWAGIVGFVSLLLLLITPSPPKFESIQPPMEVTVIADRAETPSPDLVRSLKDIQRKTLAPPTVPEAAMLNQTLPVPTPLDTEVKAVDALSAPVPPAPQLARTQPALTVLSPAELKGIAREPGKLDHEPVQLASAGPVRRLTLKEAADTSINELFPVRVHVAADVQLKAATVATTAGAGVQIPDVRVLDADKARRLEALAVFKPSPVRFEKAGGFQVPVARMRESLAPLESTGADDYKIDGKVSESEIARSWKSGRFRIHAPGNPPPEGNPATYCYVGQNSVNGKPCLYISFICSDPNVDQLIASVNRNLRIDEAPLITRDDSLEIFLDTNNDRKDYNQLIVNAHGAYWAAYFPSVIERNPFNAQLWDVQATVKTSISKEAGQWVCEIQIPFDRLGGVPAKGTRWTVNFCRNYRGQGADWQLQSWFNVYTSKREFHRPDHFGMFEW